MYLKKQRMKNIFLTFTLFVALLSCKDKEVTTEPVGPSKMEQVVAVHDELMPKMSLIGEYIMKLESNIDSANIDSIKVMTIAELKLANESMMTWMKDFGSAFESDEIMNGAALDDEKKNTLDVFEKSANELKVQMETALKNAEAALEH